METRNYIELKTLNPLKLEYAFLDTDKYLVDQIFIDNEIKVKFGKVKFGKEFKNKKRKYRFIFCSINKKDKIKFLACMGYLKNKMLLMGNYDYLKECEKITIRYE